MREEGTGDWPLAIGGREEDSSGFCSCFAEDGQSTAPGCGWLLEDTTAPKTASSGTRPGGGEKTRITEDGETGHPPPKV